MTAHLEKRQMMFKAAAVFFLSCLEGCLTIPVRKLVGTDYGVHLMLFTLENGLTAVSYVQTDL